MAENGIILTHAKVIVGPDKEEWIRETTVEFDKLIGDTATIIPRQHTCKPANRLASYFNPQISTKMKNGVLKRRVRGTYGGNISDYTGDVSACIYSRHTHNQITSKLHHFY